MARFVTLHRCSLRRRVIGSFVRRLMSQWIATPSLNCRGCSQLQVGHSKNRNRFSSLSILIINSCRQCLHQCTSRMSTLRFSYRALDNQSRDSPSVRSHWCSPDQRLSNELRAAHTHGAPATHRSDCRDHLPRMRPGKHPAGRVVRDYVSKLWF
jgi:hypothetical protein